MLVCVHACVYVGVHLRVRVCMCVRARAGSVSVCENRPRFSGQNVMLPPPHSQQGPHLRIGKKMLIPRIGGCLQRTEHLAMPLIRKKIVVATPPPPPKWGGGIGPGLSSLKNRTCILHTLS